MSGKKLTVLGTSAQVPTRSRNHSGYLFHWDDHGFLFDPGEGTQRQLTRYRVKASSITKIFITHFHGDHCLGLPGIIQRMSMDRVHHEVEIYYPASGETYLQNLLHASFYSEPVNIKACPVQTDGCIKEDDELQIHAARLDHPIEAFGYRIRKQDSFTLQPEKLKEKGIEPRNIRLLKQKGSIFHNGLRIDLSDVSLRKEGESLAFIMDTRVCDAALKLARGVDILVCEATYQDEHQSLAQEYGHLTARQAATIAQQAGVKQLVLGHFSQRYTDTHQYLIEAQSVFKEIILAHDGDCIPIASKERPLHRTAP